MSGKTQEPKLTPEQLEQARKAMDAMHKYPAPAHSSWESFNDEDADEYEESMMNCSMNRRGECGQAGSGYCEFECPFMREWREEQKEKKLP